MSSSSQNPWGGESRTTARHGHPREPCITITWWDRTGTGRALKRQWSPESSVGPSDNCASRLDPRERIHGTREFLKGAAEPGETQMNGRKHTPGHRVQTLRNGERLIGELKHPKSGHRPLCTLHLERCVISPRPVTS